MRANPIRYNARNELGDVERLNASGQTAAAKEIPAVMKILITKTGDEYEQMKKFGVINSSLWNEMNDVSKLKEFERFKNLTNQKTFAAAVKSVVLSPARLIQGVGNIEQSLTQFREDVLRAAVFLHNYKKLQAGQEVRHWAGDIADVMAVAQDDKARAAAIISRETMGDYGKFTPFENNALRNGWIPFYSWMKINGLFWPRVFKNAAKEGAADRVALIAAGVVGKNIAKWLIRALGAYAAAWLWNHRDDRAKRRERSLPFWLRTMPHVNIEKYTLWGQTALSDFTEWFDMDKLSGILWRHEAGFLNTKEAAIEAAKTIAEAPVNKVTQAVNPFIKAAVTASTGQSIYPSVFDPHFVASPASKDSVEKAVLDTMGSDAKKFYQSLVADKKGQKKPMEDTLAAYFSGWFGRPTDADTMIEEIQKSQAWTSLKNKSKTTRRRKGQAKSGKEEEWQEAQIRATATR